MKQTVNVLADCTQATRAGAGYTSVFNRSGIILDNGYWIDQPRICFSRGFWLAFAIVVGIMVIVAVLT